MLLQPVKKDADTGVFVFLNGQGGCVCMCVFYGDELSECVP